MFVAPTEETADDEVKLHLFNFDIICGQINLTLSLIFSITESMF